MQVAVEEMRTGSMAPATAAESSIAWRWVVHLCVAGPRFECVLSLECAGLDFHLCAWAT